MTREDNVRAVATKVRLGEVDAGIVYRSDIVASKAALRGIALPQDEVAVYPIAVLTDARHKTEARSFTAFVTSAAGRATMKRYGFLLP